MSLYFLLIFFGYILYDSFCKIQKNHDIKKLRFLLELTNRNIMRFFLSVSKKIVTLHKNHNILVL